MRSVFGLVLLVGLGLAGFAVYMAKDFINTTQHELERERAQKAEIVETVDIYVAGRALTYGETLKPEDVKQVRWPRSSVPKGAYNDLAVLFPNENMKPRHVLRSVEPGEAILQVKITDPGEEAGLTSMLDRGMRAFAIDVDETSGVSGFLRPGDRVDIYWTGRVTTGSERNSRRDFTKLIEANVQLVAIDQTANQEMEEGTIARTVTVAARPQQVAALAQAQSTGRLSLSLVGAEDDTIAEASEVDQRLLLGIEEEPEQVVEQTRVAKVCSIRQRRGAEVVEIPIPCSD